MECNDGIHKGLYDMGMVRCEICNEDIGSVVYSLILDYQFCACVMGLVAFHNCKLFIYMIISDTSCMIGVFTIALLTAELGQVWAKLGLRESRTTLGEIARLT